MRIGGENSYTPVVMIHNMAFDLHFIMPYIKRCVEDGMEVECCFKSAVKPLVIRLMDGDDAVMVFWDTLTFSGKGLGRMGDECGFAKLTGEWDYSLIRHAETELTDEERAYAEVDTVVPFVWLSSWLRLNPEVPENKLGWPIMTKTSVVRYKCKQLGMSRRVGDSNAYDLYLERCLEELPASREDYNLMIKATAAGWTFTSGENAGRAVGDICKYDATSMHPSHMVSHDYPVSFSIVSKSFGDACFKEVCDMTVSHIIENWEQPFKHAFNARFMFMNLRPRKGSVFAEQDVMLHGQGLFAEQYIDVEDDSVTSAMERAAVDAEGYKDTAVNPKFSFGKLVSADMAFITLNEVNAWVHAQVYEWDAVQCMACSAADLFTKPPLYVYISVAEMLKRKKVVKDAMHGELSEVDSSSWIPEHVKGALRAGDGDDTVKAFYAQVKSDLNSLYGMFATNECRQQIVFDGEGFVYDDARGFENLPDKPKAWYNFGMRIASWSRMQQAAAIMMLHDAGVLVSLVNGDTDSFAFEGDSSRVMDTLQPLHDAIGCAIRSHCAGVYDDCFKGLGEYMVDCEPDVYCAVANKRYAYIQGGCIHVASAGLPNRSAEYAIEQEMLSGATFARAVVDALGYNAVYSPELSGMKYKVNPEYGEELHMPYGIEDCNGTYYEYPAGTPLGIYLADSCKELGVGFADDYRKCLENCGGGFRTLHIYEKEE